MRIRQRDKFMSSSDAQHDARELLADVLALRQRIAKQGRQTFEKWSTHIERPSFRVAALNFAHYLAFRSQDLRSLQRRLMPLGLSSLGRAEGRVIASLDAVIHALSGITGAPVPNGMPLLRHRDRWARGLLNKQVGFELRDHGEGPTPRYEAGKGNRG